MNALETQSKDITLVTPDVERDAPLGVAWLAGDFGRETLKLMGVTDEYNKPSTIEEEKQRVRNFIESTNQMNWMIQFKEKVVGSVWVDLDDTKYLPAPSLHIMIGDPTSRGHGVGKNACIAVLAYLKNNREYENINSRYLLLNQGSANLLDGLGFEKTGDQYSDSDGLEWQNVSLSLKNL